MDEVARLVDAALYDRAGETVEGGFADRWEPNAARAREALHEVFSRRGFSDEDAALLRAAVRGPGASPGAAAALLRELAPWTRPLVEALLDDPLPAARVTAVLAGARLLDPAFLPRAARDADAAVRAAAVRALAEHRARVPGARALLERALGDPDPRVRAAAARSRGFLDDPAAGEALARRVEEETDPRVRNALVAAAARAVRSAGTHAAPDALAKRVGAPVRAMLVRELGNDAPRIRALVAGALERLRDGEVAAAMLERLRMEEDAEVRAALLLFTGYSAVAERALPVVVSLLAGDPAPLVRTRAAHRLEDFGAAAAQPLLAALRDPDGAVRRAAAMSLGRVGDVRALPALAEEFAKPGSRGFRRETETAIRDVLTRLPRSAPAPPSARLAEQIQGWIDALEPDPGSGWLLRVCKEELKAFPLHASLIYLWALRPDGTLLCMDHEAFGHPAEPEADPLAAFAVTVRGAREHPELWELIPPPPRGTQPCDACDGNGWRAEPDAWGSRFCLSCNGLGWLVPWSNARL